MKFEILAPAGSREALIAGVRSGADGVYLGGKSFNARRNAGNFDNEQLKEAVEYCRQRGVKVYLTLNILTGDGEMREAYNAVYNALQAGVDAFIVQDIGLAKMIHRCFPTARLHGSTQMSIMTPQGVRWAEENGFSRIVLPREMSVEEIRQIRKSTDLELELFVHGALCMCVSGQCYLSSVIGSRSGNRGLCAQPCRLPFTAKGDKNEYALSLKDLSLVNHIKDLDGITSLKIEGRMKRPEYVAAAVTAVKKAIEGNFSESDAYRLKSIFSRSGFTDGYFTGKTGTAMFGKREKEDVVSANAVLNDISHGYEKENPLLPIDMSLVCRDGEPCRLTASALNRTVEAVGKIPERAINKPMTADGLRDRLSKLGGTQFYPGEIKVELDEGLMLPAAEINALRRQAVERLNCIETPEVEAKPFEALTRVEKTGVKYADASFKSASQIPDSHPFENVFIPMDSSLEDFIDNRAGVVLPRGLFGIEDEVKMTLERLKKAGVGKALCGNLGTYRLAKDMGFKVFGDFGLNVYNSLSANMIENPILSFELSLNEANAVDTKNTGLIVYGRLPLMLTRNCPVKNSIGCKKCGKKGILTDRKGYEFKVMCSDWPCVEILNCYPIYMLDRLDKIKTDFVHFYFSDETPSEVKHIIDLYEKRAEPDFKYTRGLYQRGTL